MVGNAEELPRKLEPRAATNLTGTFLVSRAAIPALRKSGGGSIVKHRLVPWNRSRRQRAAYCAAKAGLPD